MTFGAAALALMNTAPAARRADGLADDRWVTGAVADWDVRLDRPVTAADLVRLRELRDLLGRLTRALITTGRLDADDLAPLNAVLSLTPVRAQVEPEGERYVIEMTPVGTDWCELAVRTVAGSFASMLRTDPTRLKVCAAPTCGTAFWDETRSRTRAWCDTRTCGNRMRVRRHRDAAIGERMGMDRYDES